MSSKWKGKKLKLVAALVFLVVYGIASLPPAQATQADATKDIKTAPASIPVSEEARLKKFLDKGGGYRTKTGGYYNPKAGTYTDEEGGVVDSWGGYTYKDGSYKSKLGDYYDAPTKTYKLADGREAKVENLTAAEAIKALRDNVAANDGYDKDSTRRSMYVQIWLDHPAKAPAARARPDKAGGRKNPRVHR